MMFQTVCTYCFYSDRWNICFYLNCLSALNHLSYPVLFTSALSESGRQPESPQFFGLTRTQPHPQYQAGRWTVNMNTDLHAKQEKKKKTYSTGHIACMQSGRVGVGRGFLRSQLWSSPNLNQVFLEHLQKALGLGDMTWSTVEIYPGRDLVLVWSCYPPVILQMQVSCFYCFGGSTKKIKK